MAKKKRAAKSSAKKAAKPSKKPSAPTYEELLAARRAVEAAHSSVRQAERELRSARTLNTFAQRDEAVVIATENLNKARSDAAETSLKFEQMKIEARKAS